MELHKEPKLAEYTMKLEQENKHLKELLNKANKEIDRLVAKRIQSRNETCEWHQTEDGWIDCHGEEWYEWYDFCPKCGGKIREVTQEEENRNAYLMHIESEIDWRREQEVGV